MQPSLRYCNICQEQFTVANLTWLGGSYLCGSCHGRHVQENPIEELPLDDEVPSETPFQLEESISSGMRYGAYGLRFGGYGLFCYLSTKNSAISDFLHGVVIADMATWMIRSCFDFRSHKLAISLELLGFAIVMNWMLGAGAVDLPQTPAAIGTAFMSFMLFFVIKTTVAVTKRLRGYDD